MITWIEDSAANRCSVEWFGALPATCPLGQNVQVKDMGYNAASHNITLQMPTGSTIDNSESGGTYVISTNGGYATVVYNGVAATVH
jgi:hypothetical protein